jgi:hypothetical protein
MRVASFPLLLLAALPLLALPPSSEPRALALQALGHLASCEEVTQEEERPAAHSRLLAAHFPTLLTATTAGWEAWDSPQAPGRVAFDALLRVWPQGAFDHWEGLVAPVFTRQLQPPALSSPPAAGVAGCGNEGHTELRLAHLLLLEAMLDTLPSAVPRLSPTARRGIVASMLHPNLVWRAGRAEATVRKAALMALHAFLRRGGGPDGGEGGEGEGSLARDGASALRALLPPLRTALEEHDATTRELAALCLEGVLSSLTLDRAEAEELEEFLVAVVDRHPELLDVFHVRLGGRVEAVV